MNNNGTDPETVAPGPDCPDEGRHFFNFIGQSDCMKRIYKTIEKVAATDSTVVIYGESGTGKELAARAIHSLSDRREYPLIAVNCGAIPEDLLESELFGHERGAFTGAIRTRIGRFELAQGGTILLDEIADMTPGLQVKLLRAIQQRQFERVGGTKTISVDVRIIAATNQDLEKAVAEKRFREDLFYRINVIPIYLPPLRERGQDIIILANHFLNKFNTQKKKSLTAITEEARDRLMAYHWPGNVRELENIMEMLVVMNGEGEITSQRLPPRINNFLKPPQAMMVEPEGNVWNLNQLVMDFEKDLIIKALRKSNGVKSRAARMLMLNRTTLVEKLKRFNLDDSGG